MPVVFLNDCLDLTSLLLLVSQVENNYL